MVRLSVAELGVLFAWIGDLYSLFIDRAVCIIQSKQ